MTTTLDITPWNLYADQRPTDARVARNVADVRAAIADARAAGLKVAPQATGHYAGALPPLDDTLLLRLDFDEPVEVDPVAGIARIPAGARWDEVVQAVAPHGLAAMHGSSPTVGAIGYLLGGGLSFYGRAHGLAVNHVVGFDVVTPDGEARRADALENPELFWALRGGGGGYGVVTAVEIALLPYADVTGGALLFAPGDARAVLRAWRDWAATAPDTITTTWRLMHPPHDAPFVIVDGVALDPVAAGELERALRAAAVPFAGGFGPMPSAAVARLHGDPEDPTPGICDSVLIDRLDDEAIEAFLRVAHPNSPLLFAELRHIGGALAASPAGAGARGHLEGEFVLFALGAPGATGMPEEIRAQIAALIAALAPVATGTRFTSFSEQWGSLRTCVPEEAFARLARLRAELDPDGLLVAPHLAS
jgi:FAD/FMN-containing dehydrogenase